MISAQLNENAKFETEITNGTHRIIADEPTELGGKDLGLTPFELLYASLAACSCITMKMYLERKAWNIQHLSCDVTSIGENELLKTIVIKGALTDEQIQRTLTIAGKCPVHKRLEDIYTIKTELVL